MSFTLHCILRIQTAWHVKIGDPVLLASVLLNHGIWKIVILHYLVERKGRGEGKFRYILSFGSLVLLVCRSLNSGKILVSKNLQNKVFLLPPHFLYGFQSLLFLLQSWWKSILIKIPFEYTLEVISNCLVLSLTDRKFLFIIPVHEGVRVLE